MIVHIIDVIGSKKAKIHMTLFFAGPDLKEVLVPEAIKPFLAKPYHWRSGYSACELARIWVDARGIPTSVDRLLRAVPEYAGLRFTRGLFECCVNLRTPGRDSQIDLLVEAECTSGKLTIAVEGKVGEPFGEYVRDLDETAGIMKRTRHLCETLKIDPDHAHNIRYQLLHRTASAIFAAQERNATYSLMLVHAFRPAERHRYQALRKSFGDYASFCTRLGVDGREDSITAPIAVGGVQLRLGWLTDEMIA